MPDPGTVRSFSLAVPQTVHAVGCVVFAVMAAWATFRALSLARRQGSDPHAVFVARLSAVLLGLAIALAVPATLKPSRGGPRELADAVRSAAALSCGVVSLFIASARRDASAVSALTSRIRELERDLGGLVSAAGDLRNQAAAVQKGAEAVATVDALTGLASRKLFDEMFARELKRAKRAERPVALAVAQVDWLDRYAGSFGRQSADQLVQGIAKIFQAQVRDTDLLVRFGPDKFAILMPETDQEKAMEVADWIRSMVANSQFANRAEMPGGKISVSIGVGTFVAAAGDASAFQGLVEGALERAAAEKNRLKAVE
ncbi:MAG: diguanylate cyclase and metal dependent [Planctomycetota bacterium]|nr:MAG: diguanylate cyclase and metal dependent [Planctomycetota bacterium]